MEKKFSDLSTKVSTFRIIELPTENPSSIEIDLLIATTSKRWIDDDDDVVSLGGNDRYKSDGWTLSNQLYVFFSFQLDDLLNSLTQFIQPYTNVTIAMEDFIGSSRVNYAYMAFNQDKFVLPDLPITVNLFK